MIFFWGFAELLFPIRSFSVRKYFLLTCNMTFKSEYLARLFSKYDLF